VAAARLQLVHNAGMYKLLSQLNQRKACGPDNNPAVFLKSCALELTNMPSFIIQQSLDTQTLPLDWRKAFVTPSRHVLGLLLFLVFINDIVTDISSPIGLFADGLLYWEVRSLSDCHILQRDLDMLVQWSKTWSMEFNVKKSNIISITNATSNKIHHQYTMDGEPVCPTDTCMCTLV